MFDTYRRMHVQWIFFLFLLGAFLIVCGNWLAVWLLRQQVQMQNSGSSFYMWNPKDAESTGHALQILGILIFVAGLVERIVLTIREGFRKTPAEPTIHDLL